MEFCDYCGEVGKWNNIVPVGFTEHEGNRVPLIKMWCGQEGCEYDDGDIDAREVILGWA